ncbi:hypothetical protein [Streptomyces sp. CC210A]|uniref:hypothetical protein n=1 Tax=Streptomyces sp. CC210A TaxID=2898184 RepID=UPI001F19E5B6|nr:hypothetical protein [Streptomyces sp. CC210A]
MTHRSALFAAVLGLGRAGSNVGDHFVQSDYCARVKGATDDKPVYLTTDDPDAEPTVHGTSDGIKACAWHCLSVGLLEVRAVVALTDVVVSASALNRRGARHVMRTAA